MGPIVAQMNDLGDLEPTKQAVFARAREAPASPLIFCVSEEAPEEEQVALAYAAASQMALSRADLTQ